MLAVPRRWIVKRTLMVLVAVLLLVVWYVAAWLLWPRFGDGILYGRAPHLVAAVSGFFEPLDWWIRIDQPGGDALNRLWCWVNPEYFVIEPAPVEHSEK